MRILIATLGSHGDVLPFLAIGKELQRRGHEVRVYSNGAFAPHARGAGLPFTSTSPAEYYDAFLNSPDATDPRKGMQMVAAGVMASVPDFYEAMRADILPGQTIVIGSTLSFAVRLLQETMQVPAAVIHLAPSLFRSEYLAPRLSPIGHLEGAPRVLKRMLWRFLDKGFLDPLYTVPFNRIRAGLGLKPVERIMHDWLHGADLTIGMFPDWFAQPQPDWPADLQLTDFPLVDNGNDEPLAKELQTFIDAGDPPFGFSAGTANASSHRFYADSAQACRLAGKRGILITQHPEQLPASLPDGVIHVDYVPFKALLPRLAGFIHHGGIGSTSQALRAGVPQIIRPMAYDQFDNASRAARLGVAKEVLPRHYRPAVVARLLMDLAGDADRRAMCRAYSEKLSQSNGIALTCDAILRRFGCSSQITSGQHS